jgi:hypothetical protein
MTQYIVLSMTGGKWTSHGVYEGSSATRAIHAYANGSEDGIDGQYVAVPVRSWQPIKVFREVQTRLRFEEFDQEPDVLAAPAQPEEQRGD